MIGLNPIYNDYISFLKDKGFNFPEVNIKEGYYWLDRQIIKGFNKKNGNLEKIVKVNVTEDLEVSFKKYKTFKDDSEFESWDETYLRNKSKIDKLLSESDRMIENMIKKYKEFRPVVLTSTGKDSMLTSFLVEKHIQNVEKLFNNTSVDSAETYLLAKEIPNCNILNPEEGFYQWVKRTEMIPSRFHRACCTLYKEGSTYDFYGKSKVLFFLGMRNQESSTRSSYDFEYRNVNWKSEDYVGCLPIKNWSDLDVWLFTIKNNININKKYKMGYSRVGCSVVCPYYSKSTWVLDKYYYKNNYERWHRILEDDFIKNNKWLRMNCTLEEYHKNWSGGLIRKEPIDEVIEEFAKYNNLDFDVAKRFFNNKCCICNKKVNQKNINSMNFKFNGRNTDKLYCKKHLMEILNIDKVQWDKYIEQFKRQECRLF